MGWIKDIADPRFRKWEDFYRNRFQHDKIVRSTHGVNCTGGCSWMVYVKNGIITWELQALDYPNFDPLLPGYEPRGCQRGISFSWYIYSPLRVKYPYIRGKLWDLWQEAKKQNPDPVRAWASIMKDSTKRKIYQQARGKGGFRRASWEDCLEIIAASLIHTIKEYGPDRIIGFSPIPAMSMLSYAAGSRFLQLLGGVALSFYDWYSDLPNASPEIWGEQTDVGESADWFNARFIAVMGSNVNMTRTPDAHYLAEVRHRGAKVVVFSPDLSQVSKYADEWIPVHAGQDGAFWMGVNHVILKEYIHEKQEPYFINYLKQFSDTPFLVKLKEHGEGWVAGKFLKASDISHFKDEENGAWKPCLWDQRTQKVEIPQGTIGHRWQKQKGKWNLKLTSSRTGEPIDPALTFLSMKEKTLPVAFPDPASDKVYYRHVPVRYIETREGKIPVTTVLDLLFARFGVSRGLQGDYPTSYEDFMPYTPAWQEGYTGVEAKVVLRFARQWADTAIKSKGKCMIIIGAGINHWYHNNLIYRSAILALILTGSVGTNGGGLNHYVGQEKVVPLSAWATLAFAGDWLVPPRLQNTPSFHYIHTDQWRYEAPMKPPTEKNTYPFFSVSHTAELQAKAVRLGWLPFNPQLNTNPINLAERLAKEGKTTVEAVKEAVVKGLKEGSLKFAVEDPDAPENWPRVWFIWRGNALMSSAKGHEYFLRHYLGTHDNIVAEEPDLSALKEIHVPPQAPRGKLDLVVDLNFRMDTSALYSDIVLPAATWYEKDDLNSTDLHSYIHPLQAAVPPCWESRSDWDIFKAIAEKFSQFAKIHFPNPIKDIVLTPLLHDTPAELAQPSVKDWKKGEVDPIPGKTMPGISLVERDYPHLYHRFITLGPRVAEVGISAHGLNWKADDLYEELIQHYPVERWDGKVYPSLKAARDAANVLLYLAPETHGKVALRAFEAEETKTGMVLKDLVQGYQDIRYTFDDLVAHPCRSLPSPIWTGIPVEGRAYAPYCLNREKLVPWRTLTGRQHTYLDHEAYLFFDENLPIHKPKLTIEETRDLQISPSSNGKLPLNYITPHGKWHIHSTYFDNLRMLTLSRGCEPLWLSAEDAKKLNIQDNDWVEAYNDNGVVVTRAVVSHRIPPGVCILYHSPERTVGVPKSPLRRGRRGGGHNSLTRTRLKPVFMAGGYAHFTYFFNYWGPVGVNRDTYIYVRKLPGEPQW